MSVAERAAGPGGSVSTIRGHWQVPALTFATRAMLILAVAAIVLPGMLASGAETAVVTAAVAIPILRVCWLVIRWTQERDTRFVVVGLLLLTVIAVGATIALAATG